MDAFEPGDEITTKNGRRFLVIEVRLWDADDGEVFGQERMRDGSLEQPKYIGTVVGLRSFMLRKSRFKFA